VTRDVEEVVLHLMGVAADDVDRCQLTEQVVPGGQIEWGGRSLSPASHLSVRADELVWQRSRLFEEELPQAVLVSW
jgi:hypothetical protein